MSSLYFVSLDEAESAELSDILGQMGAIYGSYQVPCNSHFQNPSIVNIS